MSLLLEALKKAELAKQNSLGISPQPEDFVATEIRFEEPAAPTMHATPPLEDFPEPVIERAAPPVPPPEPVPSAPAPRSAAKPAPPPEPEVAATAPTPDPQRAAARQLFDVKEVDYNPKRPFYITLAVLGLAAVGYGVYLWWQLQPRTTVNTSAIQSAPKSKPVERVAPPPPPTDSAETPNAAPSTEPAANAKAETAPSQAAAQPATKAEAKPAAAAPAGAGAAAKSPQAPAASSPASVPTPSTFLRQGQPAAAVNAPATTPAAPASASPSAPPPRPAARREARLPIKVTPPSFQANEVLESAYAAFQRGEFDRARTEYQQVLVREPTNRDALLGLAAIDVRTRDFAMAELRYMKLLELDPRDTYANAALMAMQGNVDPVQSESRIKNLIASQPEATHLYFSLGNQYAAQKRWTEAQSAYFKAFSAEPDNADFAFNLAVSLDHMRQGRLAAEYYRKAISIAGSRPVSFDRKQAEARAKELER